MGKALFAAYDLPLYRPPSEARSLIIQATIGCSFNRCTFCAMYKTKTFRQRPLADVVTDVAAAARLWPATSRVFLADGDALCLPAEHLGAILDTLRTAFPRLERVSLYATPIDLNRKSGAELRQLRDNGLTLAYLARRVRLGGRAGAHPQGRKPERHRHRDRPRTRRRPRYLGDRHPRPRRSRALA